MTKNNNKGETSDPFKDPEYAERLIDLDLKSHYGNYIDSDFLIEIKSRVIERLATLKPEECKESKFYLFDQFFRFPVFQRELCRHIIGIHHSNMMFEGKAGRLKAEKNEDYKTKLIDDAFKLIRLRQFGSIYYREQAVIPGDQFTYFPVPDLLFIICKRMLELLNHEHELQTHFIDFFERSLSALLLLGDNLFSSAYSLTRSIVEQYFKLMILYLHPEAIEAYKKYYGFQIHRTAELKHSESFKEYCRKRWPGKTSSLSLLHFGWLDEIKDYKPDKKYPRYSIEGIVDYLKIHLSEHKCFLTLLYDKLYKRCHEFVHGNMTSQGWCLLHYFEITLMLFLSIHGVVCTIATDVPWFSLNGLVIDGIDLLNELADKFSKLCQQYGEKSTEKFHDYYTNIFTVS